MRSRRWFKAPLVLLLIAAVLIAASFAVMLLWNAVIPALFSGPVITFWQSMELLVLSKILFGRFGPRRGGWHHGNYRGNWRRKFEEKMASMTPEEREKFRYNCRSRFGRWQWEESEKEESKKEETTEPASTGTESK